MSCSLTASERFSPMVEKEATAMIEAVRPWSHSSKGRRFTLVTDQEAVLFIFDQSNGGKIKNAKILNWKLVLSHMTYNIRHKPGSEKIAADASSPCFVLSHFFAKPPSVSGPPWLCATLTLCEAA